MNTFFFFFTLNLEICGTSISLTEVYTNKIRTAKCTSFWISMLLNTNSHYCYWLTWLIIVLHFIHLPFFLWYLNSQVIGVWHQPLCQLLPKFICKLVNYRLIFKKNRTISGYRNKFHNPWDIRNYNQKIQTSIPLCGKYVFLTVKNQNAQFAIFETPSDYQPYY